MKRGESILLDRGLHQIGRRRADFSAFGLALAAVVHVALVGGALAEASEVLSSARPVLSRPHVAARLVRTSRQKQRKKGRRLPEMIDAAGGRRSVRAADLKGARPGKDGGVAAGDTEADAAQRRKLAYRRAEAFSSKEGRPAKAEEASVVVPAGATDGMGGDPYLARIAEIWDRNWALPAIISAEVARSLHALVVIWLDADGWIRFPVVFDRPSGNTQFDASIRLAWRKISRLPLPKGKEASIIVKTGLALRLTYKGIR